MKIFINVLKNAKLFAQMSENEILSLMKDFDVKTYKIKKDEYAFYQGERINDILILLEGKLHIQKEDYWGNLSILSEINVSEMFGESFLSPCSPALMNDVIATCDSTILLFDINKIFSANNDKLIKNLFSTISEKNRILVTKLGYMSKRSTKEKLLAYFSDQAKKQNSNSFLIPFNRQQLADFLSVDRSAMSSELSKMKKDGILSFDKNRFTLYS